MQKQAWGITLVFWGCHSMSVTPALCLFKSLCLSHPANYTQPTQIKSKNPQGLSSQMGECPISFSLGWLPAESNKGLCYAALLQISVA